MARPFSVRWLKRRLALIIFFTTTVLLFWYFGAFPGQSLVVTLPGYGSFQGIQLLTNSKKTAPLDRPVTAWMGVEYSTQPIDHDRFKPVSWPKAFHGTKDALSSGPRCFQHMNHSVGQSEACLTINVYRPSNIAMEEKLPALVFLHGGSFVMGSHQSFDGALFVAKSKQPLMVITAQYRLGALGTLPGKFMEEADLLNLGIRDQRMMLKFLQKYISEFGGDGNKITLGGQSAGGHSVGFHMFHNYGEDAGKPLFSQAILSSGSPMARAFPGVDYALYQRQVEQFMDYIKCPLTPGSAALKCLRSAEADDIQFISSSLHKAHTYNTTWPWQPVSPGPLLEKSGSQSGFDGSFFKMPTLISSTTDEGKGFVPQDLRNNEEFLNFWANLAPALSKADLAELEALYPESDADILFGATKSITLQFERIAAAYGDFAYICAVQDTASRLAAAGAPVYKSRFNTPNRAPKNMGVPHASDTAYFNGQSGTQYPAIADMYSAYWASFVASGDPNTYAAEGAPIWERYAGVEKNGALLVVSPLKRGGTKMEKEGEGIRMEQCRWWRDKDRVKRLYK